MDIGRFTNILAQVNAETGLDIALYPAYSPEKTAQDGTGIGYMLFRPGETPVRKLLLILDQASHNHAEASTQIGAEIRSFWASGNEELSRTRTIFY
jgi:hypothetical protein